MVEIRKASTIDPAELRRFYGDAFPDRAAFLSEHWRWLYRLGRFPGIEPLVLVAAERVVGHAGVIPATLSCAGKPATAMWFVDFHLQAEFRGQGHGKALAAAWAAQCPNRLTFCNERTIEVLRKFGWTERFDAVALTQPLRFSGLSAALGAPLRAYLRARTLGAPAPALSPLPLDAGGLAERLDDAAAATRVARDADWVRWRLLENPRRCEHVLAEAGGVSAVFRAFDSLGRRRAHLLHVGPGAAPARAGMVKAFARWALDQLADDLWLATTDATLLAAGAPLLARRHPLRFAWHSEDAAVAAALANPLPTQGIDSDHDLLFP